MSSVGLKFSHMGIFVRDIHAMEAFYSTTLDFTVTDRGELTRNGRLMRLVFLSRNPDEHHQIVLVSGRPAEDGFNPINQISLKADSLETLIQYYDRFVSQGRAGVDPISHGNAVSFYAPDPEGNRLEVYWDTPWYVSQPSAEPIDLTLPPSTLLHRLETQAQASPGFKTRLEWRSEMAALMQRG